MVSMRSIYICSRFRKKKHRHLYSNAQSNYGLNTGFLLQDSLENSRSDGINTEGVVEDLDARAVVVGYI